MRDFHLLHVLEAARRRLGRSRFVADKQGTYTAQLIVSDPSSSSTPSTVTITTGNTAPIGGGIADFAYYGGVTLDNTPVTGNTPDDTWNVN